MRLSDCHGFDDFRRLAKKRLPAPVFHYIDGGADDEVTLRRNTESFERCDLVPNVLRGSEHIDLSVTMLGQHLDMPVYCSPTALQRLFHHQGERAVGKAAAAHGTLFGCSSLGTVSLEELRETCATPQAYQFYFHKDRALNRAMLQRAKAAGVDVMMLTVDSITGGNRERDLRSGFTVPMRLTPSSMVEFLRKPRWALDYVFRAPFSLPQLDAHIRMDGGAMSVGGYFTEMLDKTLDWDDVADMIAQWDKPFCLKGVMSVDDARRAVDVGCAGIILSNHGGRQLDGSRTPFDQLSAVMDAVGGEIDVMMDSGVRRGTHALKALCLGATAVGVGRYYLFPLAAAGEAGVNRALGLMRDELERGMRLLGCAAVADLRTGHVTFDRQIAHELDRHCPASQ
ncbi:MAG: alpha-hydroxy acid oxidase [Pseudomonadota bacterium]